MKAPHLDKVLLRGHLCRKAGLSQSQPLQQLRSRPHILCGHLHIIAAMMETNTNPAQQAQIILTLHTAVDYLHRSGVGIGLVQQAQCATTGVTQNHLVPARDRKYGITRQNFGVNNVKTGTRAQMLALLHALGLARSTIKSGPRKDVCFQSIVVFSDSSNAVQLINEHIELGPDSLRYVKSANDRKMIKRVLSAVQKLSRRGLHTSIRVTSTASIAGGEAQKLARQKGRKACKSRRRLWLAQNISLSEDVEIGGDSGAFEEGLELHL